MDSPQSVVSPFKIGESENENSNSVQSSGNRSNGIKSNGKDSISCGQQELVGTLEVYVHQARDIHNICIYHKQDVYAKLCLTSDPEKSVSTKIINGGGRNPVFDDNVKLDVRVVDTSLKCEIYMMSRVKNYLEDQLLGFTLVPMSELLFKNGKLEKEFSLSSTDLYHSPAGFVHLSLSYNGSYPEVMAIPNMPSSVSVDETTKDPERSESVPGELDKIEFPDPNVANENEQMVSEYFGISCSTIDSETSDSLVTSDADNHVTHSVTSILKPDSPESSNATNGAASPHASAHSGTETPNHEHLSLMNSKEKSQDSGSEASGETSEEKIVKPVLTVKVEPESKVVQQDIVDMYMKSMQQFTDSLAKMKLPLDIDSPTKSENSSSDSQKLPTPKSNNGSRVFYGSRPFF
ncbi:Protein SRC2 [Cardamine amara subsp. amara]|uniref:Protein SRC2 n=1 Tax=Cardamine amara subsp. amara TaxID=228776 RepID=A0ABD1A0V6_CARAN